MNPDMKKKWVEALRSGKYVQGSGSLRYTTYSGAKHCCLGVLCEITGYKNSEAYDRFHEVGLNDDSIQTLWRMNDTAQIEELPLPLANRTKYSFNQIADWIEENL